MSDNVTTMQTNVRLRLAHYGISLSRLAALQGIERATASFWLNSHNPTLASLEKLANFVHVPTWALLHPDFDPKEFPIPDKVREAIHGAVA